MSRSLESKLIELKNTSHSSTTASLELSSPQHSSPAFNSSMHIIHKSSPKSKSSGDSISRQSDVERDGETPAVSTSSVPKIAWVIKDTTNAVIQHHKREERRREGISKEKISDDCGSENDETSLTVPPRRDSSLMHDESSSAGTEHSPMFCSSPMDLTCSPVVGMPARSSSEEANDTTSTLSSTQYPAQFPQFLQGILPPETLKSKFSSLFSVLKPDSAPPTPEEANFLIIDFLFMIRAFCRTELNDMVSNQWEQILDMSLNIKAVDYLALFIVEFGKLFETKWMDGSVREVLVGRLMDNIGCDGDDSPEESLSPQEQRCREQLESMYTDQFDTTSTASNMVWMNVLAVEILCLNQQACERGEVQAPQQKSSTSTVKSLFDTKIMDHKNYSTFYDTFTQDIVHHAQNDVMEYNMYRFRFLSLIFSNDSLSSAVLYMSDLECLLRTVLDIVGNLAEKQTNSAQLMFDEAAATLIDILKSDAYRSTYNCVLLKDIEKLVNYVAKNESGYCCENAVMSACMIRRILPK